MKYFYLVFAAFFCVPFLSYNLSYSSDTFKTNYQSTPLHNATKGGDAEEVKRLLDNGADPNKKNENGKTVIDFALSDYKHICIQPLLESKKSNHSLEHFTYSLRHNLVKAVQVILTIAPHFINKTLTWNEENEEYGNKHLPPLFGYLTFVKKPIIPMIKTLLSFKAATNVEMTTNTQYPLVKGDTPLHVLSRRYTHDLKADNILKDIASLLISKGAPVDTKNSKGETPLLIAAKHGHAAFVKLLLDKKASDDGYELLHQALLSYSQNSQTSDLYLSDYRDKFIQYLLKRKKTNLTLKHFTCALKYNLVKSAEIMLAKNPTFINKTLSLTRWGNTQYNLTPLLGYLEVVEKMSLHMIKMLLSFKATPKEKVEKMKENVYALVPGDTPLHILSRRHTHNQKEDNILKDIASLLISKGAPVDTKNSKGETPLLIAVKEGHAPLVELLINKKADSNSVNNVGHTLLHTALLTQLDGNRSSLSYLNTMKVLIDKKVPIDRRDLSGWAPIHYATYHQSSRMIELLASENANLKLPTTKSKKLGYDKTDYPSNSTPFQISSTSTAKLFFMNGAQTLPVETHRLSRLFHKAVENRDIKFVRFLLSKGVSPDIKDEQGNTALHIIPDRYSTTVGSKKLKIAKLLISHGATIDSTNYRKETPLHHAAACNNPAMITLLLLHGANPDLKNVDGDTPLYRTILYTSDNELIQDLSFKLIAEKSSQGIFTANNEGNTLLHQAIQGYYSNFAIIKYLLSQGVPVNARNKTGLTALHLAVKGSKIQIVGLLLSYKADPLIKDNTGKSSHNYLLASKSYSQTSIPYIKKTEKIKHLLTQHLVVSQKTTKEKSKISYSEPFLYSLLMLQTPNEKTLNLIKKIVYEACIKGDIKLVKQCLDAKVPLTKTNIDGLTPLHLAVLHGHETIVRLLLKNKVPVNYQARGISNKGKTPLHCAIEKGYGTIGKLLLAHQANPLAQDTDGNTILHYAVRHRNLSCLQSLLTPQNARKLITLENKKKQNPIELANEMEGAESIVIDLLNWKTQLTKS